MSTPSYPRPSLATLERANELKAQYQSEAAAEFEAGFGDLFARYPRLVAVSWGGGSEYNDEGGSDYYSNHQEPSINGFSDYDAEEGGDDGENLHELAKVDDEAAVIVEAVKAFLRAFDQDFMEYEYYDGATATREGIE